MSPQKHLSISPVTKRRAESPFSFCAAVVSFSSIIPQRPALSHGSCSVYPAILLLSESFSSLTLTSRENVQSSAEPCLDLIEAFESDLAADLINAVKLVGVMLHAPDTQSLGRTDHKKLAREFTFSDIGDRPVVS